MYYNKVELCGVDTSKLKSIDDDKKRELLVLSKNGDIRAREELIDGNLRLVLSIIQRFGSRRESMDDLFQVGCIGLMKAIDNFNVDLDVKFSTYAVPMIIGEVRRYLRDNNIIRVSRSIRDVAYKSLSCKEELTKALMREPTIEELSRATGFEPEQISMALEAIIEPVSIYEPVYSDGVDSIYVIDQLSDRENNDEAWLEDISLKEALKKLSEREKKIISLRFYRGKTQMEIADEIGISQAQVSRIEKGALDKIKKNM